MDFEDCISLENKIEECEEHLRMQMYYNIKLIEIVVNIY